MITARRLAILFFTLASFLHSSLTAAESVPPKSLPDDAGSSASGDDSCLDASYDDKKSSVYVIGDIHGDVLCAISWVHRTGLIENLLDESSNSDESATDVYEKLNSPTEWKWNDDQATLGECHEAQLLYSAYY